VANYEKRNRRIIIEDLGKINLKLGGRDHIVEIHESLFVKVKHNRMCDMHRPQI